MSVSLKCRNVISNVWKVVVVLLVVGIFVITKKTAMAQETNEIEDGGFEIVCKTGNTTPELGETVILVVESNNQSVNCEDCEYSWYQDGELLNEYSGNYQVKEDELRIEYFDTTEAGYYSVEVFDGFQEYTTEPIMIGTCDDMSAELFIVQPQEYYQVGDTIFFDVELNGGGGDIEYVYEITDVSSGKKETYITYTSSGYSDIDYGPQTSGNKIIKLTATDAYGNVATDTISINVIERLKVEFFIDGKKDDRDMSTSVPALAEVKVSGAIGE